MIVTAHQPLYLPWLGFFHKAASADKICILDDVQFSDGDFINRNRIKGLAGPQWLTVPIAKKGHGQRLIKDIVVIHDGWQRRHVAALRHAYARAPFFHDYIAEIEGLILRKEWVFLFDLDIAFLELAFSILEIQTQIILSSSLKIEEKKSELILNMCQKLGADVYISGENGLDYLDVPKFHMHHINVKIQNYVSPKYQQSGASFVPNLSFIDLLFNAGPQSKEILMSGNSESILDVTNGKEG